MRGFHLYMPRKFHTIKNGKFIAEWLLGGLFIASVM